MKTIAIIQARMGSTRLPGKVLQDILDKPMLWHIVARIGFIPEITRVIVATSDRKADNRIAHFCLGEGIDCFRGSESDVLDRFYRAARNENPEAVIRITGDCPLVDPHLVRKLLLWFIESGNFDHLGLATGAGVAHGEFRQPRFPDGLDAEVIRFEALRRAWLEAKDPLEREHVTPFIWKHPERFRLGCLASEEDYSTMRWTVDNPEDLELVRDIYGSLYAKNPCFGLEDILGYLKDNPLVMQKNARFIGREGYEVFWLAEERNLP
ncbi:MAG: glycosyltransferase family protein [bacterium]